MLCINSAEDQMKYVDRKKQKQLKICSGQDVMHFEHKPEKKL